MLALVGIFGVLRQRLPAVAGCKRLGQQDDVRLVLQADLGHPQRSGIVGLQHAVHGGQGDGGDLDLPDPALFTGPRGGGRFLGRKTSHSYENSVAALVNPARPLAALARNCRRRIAGLGDGVMVFMGICGVLPVGRGIVGRGRLLGVNLYAREPTARGPLL